jgi:hypothetical protein
MWALSRRLNENERCKTITDVFLLQERIMAHVRLSYCSRGLEEPKHLFLQFVHLHFVQNTYNPKLRDT